MVEPVYTFDDGSGNSLSLYAADADPSVFGDYGPFVSMWQEKCAGRALPAWRDFSFEDLTPWIGRLLVVDLDFRDGIDGTYRLCGGEWVSIFDSDLTGKRYKKVMTEDVKNRSKPYLSALFSERLIGYRVMSSYWFQRDFIKIELLDLLLSDNGETATQYLGVAKVFRAP